MPRSRGHEFDYNLPNAYQYRDYVIRAFNRDVPYNQFVTEHLAGDLMPKPRMHPTEKFNESILGTGFWFLGEQVHSPVDICQDRADRHDNMIDVMSQDVPRPDGRLRPLPRPQVRRHFDQGLLRPGRVPAEQQLSPGLLRFAGPQPRRGPEVGGGAPQDASVHLGGPGPGGSARHGAPGRLSARGTGSADQDAFQGRSRASSAVKAEVLDRWLGHLPRVRQGRQRSIPSLGEDYFRFLRDRARPGSQAIARRWLMIWRKQLVPESAPRAEDVVIDYAKSDAKDWIQDGFSFGTGPVRPGDLRHGMDPARPILQVVEHGAAWADSAWDGLKLLSGFENESGSLARNERAGRTLSTPSFQVKSGRVHFLVKGTGLAYANVEGHVMIAGPLHAQVVVPIKAGPTSSGLARI